MIVAVAVGLKAARSNQDARALPAYFYRLPARAQRSWLQSDSIDRFDLVPDLAIFSLTKSLMVALPSGAPLIVERTAQALADRICRLMGIRGVRIEVRGVRPDGELG